MIYSGMLGLSAVAHSLTRKQRSTISDFNFSGKLTGSTWKNALVRVICELISGFACNCLRRKMHVMVSQAIIIAELLNRTMLLNYILFLIKMQKTKSSQVGNSHFVSFIKQKQCAYLCYVIVLIINYFRLVQSRRHSVQNNLFNSQDSHTCEN